MEGREHLFDLKDVPVGVMQVATDNEFENMNKKIIDDVFEGVGSAFAEEGVGDDVMALLKKLWISKLAARGTEEGTTDIVEDEEAEALAVAASGRSEELATESDSTPSPIHGFDESGEPVPASSTSLSKKFGLPSSITVTPSTSGGLGARPKTTMKKRSKSLQQLDGPNDTSDDEDNDEDDSDSDNDDDDDDDDLDDANDEDGEDEGAEEEPLGSGDDISDEDPSDLFNTENVVVCQFDKITRTRNKWKFTLKDGIMNIQSKDYVFQRATGEAEW